MQKFFFSSVLVLALLLNTGYTSQAASWTAQDSGSNSNFYSISCPSALDCYVVGASNTLLASHTGGAPWAAQAHSGSGLQAISCPSVSTCVVVGNAGTIIATSNANTAENWNSQTSGTTADLHGLACPSVTVCYAVGGDANKQAVVIATTNGGVNWNAPYNSSTPELFALSCPDVNTCYGVGVNGSILATTDGGVNWNAQTSGTTNNLSGITCTSSSSCYAVGDKGTILQTTNSGANWNSQTSSTTIYLRQIFCSDQNTCTVVGSDTLGKNGLILQNMAGGWQPVATNPNGLFGVSCKASNCVVVGFGGTILSNYSPNTVSLIPTDSSAFNNPGFANTWFRPDKPVSQIPNVGRGYTWGPLVGNALSIKQENYNGGQRTVQYFDKARMEVNNPNGNTADPYFVTTGLLVKELVTGNRQDGDNTFVQLQPSTVQIAGDPNDGGANAIAPTYASFKNVVTFFGTQNGVANQNGVSIVNHIAKAGNVTTITPAENRRLVGYDDITHHNIADVFVTYGNQTGLIWDGSQYSQGGVFYPNYVYVLGRPVTDPYWVDAVVAGQQQPVLVQLFERRVLTYTPSNPDGFKVEVGNVGQHYYKWRYVLNQP